MPEPEGPEAGTNGPAHLVCPQFVTSLSGCPVCVPQLCRARAGDEWSMGWGCCAVLTSCSMWPAPPSSPTPGWEGTSLLCLADICRIVRPILVSRQPVSNKDGAVPLYAAALGLSQA